MFELAPPPPWYLSVWQFYDSSRGGKRLIFVSASGPLEGKQYGPCAGLAPVLTRSKKNSGPPHSFTFPRNTNDMATMLIVGSRSAQRSIKGLLSKDLVPYHRSLKSGSKLVGETDTSADEMLRVALVVNRDGLGHVTARLARNSPFSLQSYFH